MTRPMRYLILKDWRLHRPHIIFSIAGGVAALALLQVRSEVAGFIGIVWFFVALIVLGSMLPSSNVVNERKKQTLAFVMSLPVSAVEYTTAKFISTVGMFLVPWLTLVIAAWSLIASRSDIPNGFIPMMIVLAMLTMVGFCVIAGVALVSESEGWTIAATVVCNSTYGLSWYLMIRNPEVRNSLANTNVVWAPAVLNIFLMELLAIAVILGVTLYLQSRKRSFI